MISLSEIAQKAGIFVGKNSPTILSGIAVAGTVATAYLTGKAAFKAALVIEEHEVSPVGGIRDELTPREKFDYTWKLFVPAAGTGVITVAAIIASNRIGMRRTAAFASAVAISEKAFAEYQAKVIEKVGQRKETDIRDEIAQDRVTKHPPTEIFIADTTKTHCYDLYSGRYFESSVEDIKAAQNKMNYRINHEMYVSLNEFYEEIGLSRTYAGDDVGWNLDHEVEVKFSAVIAENNKPVIAIDFHVMPVRNYHKHG